MNLFHDYNVALSRAFLAATALVCVQLGSRNVPLKAKYLVPLAVTIVCILELAVDACIDASRLSAAIRARFASP